MAVGATGGAVVTATDGTGVNPGGGGGGVAIRAADVVGTGAVGPGAVAAGVVTGPLVTGPLVTGPLVTGPPVPGAVAGGLVSAVGNSGAAAGVEATAGGVPGGPAARAGAVGAVGVVGVAGDVAAAGVVLAEPPVQPATAGTTVRTAARTPAVLSAGGRWRGTRRACQAGREDGPAVVPWGTTSPVDGCGRESDGEVRSVVPVLPTVVVVLALAAAAYAVWLVIRDRLTDVPLLVATGVVEVALLAQTLVGFVELARTDRAVSAAVFVGYLLTALLVLPAGLLWGLLEHSRWGPGVVAAACLVVPVLVVRLQSVWTTGA